MIDIHSHILPGLDDGSKNETEFLDALQKSKEQGFTEIICTPHYYPAAVRSYVALTKGQSADCTKKQILEVYHRMQPSAAKQGIKLHIGMECFYHSTLPSLIEKGEVLSLAGSRYMLIEFDHKAPFIEIENGLRVIKDAGYLPILAHYERYQSLMAKGRLEELKENGALLQMNFDTVQRYYGWWLRRNGFRDDLKAGLVDFMGSDCHGTHFRPLRIRPSVEWMERHVKEVHQILEENPGKIITGEV